MDKVFQFSIFTPLLQGFFLDFLRVSKQNSSFRPLKTNSGFSRHVFQLFVSIEHFIRPSKVNFRKSRDFEGCKLDFFGKLNLKGVFQGLKKSGARPKKITDPDQLQ